MKKLRIFVSSVQKELEIERVALAGWVSSDPRLSEVCEIILFEKEPLSGKRIIKPYLECLKTCRLYLLILDCEYGNPPEFSATHEEYRFAKENDLPMLIFIKGMTDVKREEKTKTAGRVASDPVRGNAVACDLDRLSLSKSERKKQICGRLIPR